MRPVAVATVISLALVAIYFVAGGSSYGPDEVADPCEQREWRDPGSIDDLGQQLALSGMDGAACELDVTREKLARALASDSSLDAFMAENDIDEAELDQAVRAGLERVIDDARDAGEIGPIVATGLRSAVRVIPARQAFELLLDARPLLEQGSGFLDGFSEFDLGGVIGGLGSG